MPKEFNGIRVQVTEELLGFEPTIVMNSDQMLTQIFGTFGPSIAFDLLDNVKSYNWILY